MTFRKRVLVFIILVVVIVVCALLRRHLLSTPHAVASLQQKQQHQHSIRELIYKETPDLEKTLPQQFLPNTTNPCWYDDYNRLRCLPKIFLAGMPKCGSTDLFIKLIWHPDIISPFGGKENHYWTRTRIGRSGIHLVEGFQKPLSLNEHVDFVLGTTENEGYKNKYIIDGTQSLAWDHKTWEQRYPNSSFPPFTNAQLIKTLLPDSKILFIVRNPTERLYSDFLYFGTVFKKNRTVEMFHKMVQEEIASFQDCRETHSLETCCYSSERNSAEVRLFVGVYICFVKDWFYNFGDQLLVVTLEDYSIHEMTTLLKIYSFIGVRQPKIEHLREYLDHTKARNTRKKSDVLKGDMLPETKELLNDFYAPFNKQLSLLLKDTRFLF